jgi:superfamily II DNA or RNA helicase
VKLESDLLRPGQRGALHALLAHFSGSHRGAVAQIHLPAGYGKTLVMMLASIMFGDGKQTLVVCGSTGLREQLHHHFSGMYGEGGEAGDASKLGLLARSLLSSSERPTRHHGRRPEVGGRSPTS